MSESFWSDRNYVLVHTSELEDLQRAQPFWAFALFGAVSGILWAVFFYAVLHLVF